MRELFLARQATKFPHLVLCSVSASPSLAA
jgi:hypothetical protein